MSIRPELVLVDLHDTCILVTLRQVVCAAERNYARERLSRELLEKLYAEAFGAVKTELETAVTQIVGRQVHQSRISVDPIVGDAILVFMLGQGEPSVRQEREDNSV